MEYTTRKEKIFIPYTAYEGCKEQPVDIDLTLPDYCPDVRRVLKCRITPQINSKSITGDTLEIDGNAIVSIFYTDAQTKAVRCYEHTFPFNCGFNIKNPPSDCIIMAKTKTEYINCRALTQRRLDLHGAFSLCVRVLCKGEREIISSIEEKDIQQKLFKMKAVQLSAMGQQQMTVSEAVSLPGGKPPVQTIIRKDVKVLINEVRLITAKAMLKGDIAVKLLYLTDIEKGSTETFEFTLPFSQIVDAEGCDENCMCFTSAEVGSVSIIGASDSDSGENVINCEVRMTLSALMYNEIDIQTVSDAYSTEYNLVSRSSQLSLPELTTTLNEIITEKPCLNLGEKQLAAITDIWTDNISLKAEIAEGKPVLKGKLNINILAADTEEEPFFAERAVDIVYPIDNARDVNTIAEVYAVPYSISYRMNGDSSLEVRVDIKVSGIVFTDLKHDCIIEAEADEDTPLQKDNAALVLYYSERGESLWEIAKKYKTAMTGIMEENDLKEETADGGLLILPI